MFCTVGKIAQVMDEIAPERWAEDWDNVGLLLGNRGSKVRRLMVVLDISPDVVEEAIEKEVDMIISHHPLIFKPLDRVVGDSIEGRLIMSLMSQNISVYSAHTNLDMAKGGVDDTLAKVLGLEDVQLLTSETMDDLSKPGFGRWGRLNSPISLDKFVDIVGKSLKIPSIDIIGNKKDMGDKFIRTVALCGGSGADFMKQAQRVGVDLFITGEVKYHDALAADWLGIDIMAIGHFYSEIPVVKELISRLQMIMNSLQYKVEILESVMQVSPYTRIIID